MKIQTKTMSSYLTLTMIVSFMKKIVKGSKRGQRVRKTKLATRRRIEKNSREERAKFQRKKETRKRYRKKIRTGVGIKRRKVKRIRKRMEILQV